MMIQKTALSLLACVVARAAAADFKWTATQEWGDATNWPAGVPTNKDNVGLGVPACANGNTVQNILVTATAQAIASAITFGEGVEIEIADEGELVFGDAPSQATKPNAPFSATWGCKSDEAMDLRCGKNWDTGTVPCVDDTAVFGTTASGNNDALPVFKAVKFGAVELDQFEEAPTGFTNAFVKEVKNIDADVDAVDISCYDTCIDTSNNTDAYARATAQHHAKGVYMKKLLGGVRARHARALPAVGDKPPVLTTGDQAKVSGQVKVKDGGSIFVMVHKKNIDDDVAPVADAGSEAGEAGAAPPAPMDVGDMEDKLNKKLGDLQCLQAGAATIERCNLVRSRTKADTFCGDEMTFVESMRPFKKSQSSCADVLASHASPYKNSYNAWKAAAPRAAAEVAASCCGPEAAYSRFKCMIAVGDDGVRATTLPLVVKAVTVVAQARGLSAKESADYGCGEEKVDAFGVSLGMADGKYLSVPTDASPKMAVLALATKSMAANLANPMYNDATFDNNLRLLKVLGQVVEGTPPMKEADQNQFAEAIQGALADLLPFDVTRAQKPTVSTSPDAQLDMSNLAIIWVTGADGLVLDMQALKQTVADALFFFALELEVEQVNRAEFGLLTTVTTTTVTTPPATLPARPMATTNSPSDKSAATALKNAAAQFAADTAWLEGIKDAAKKEPQAKADQLTKVSAPAIKAAANKLDTCNDKERKFLTNPAGISPKCAKELAALNKAKSEAAAFVQYDDSGCVHDASYKAEQDAQDAIDEYAAAFLANMTAIVKLDGTETDAEIREKNKLVAKVNTEVSKLANRSRVSMASEQERATALADAKQDAKKTINDKFTTWKGKYEACTKKRMDKYNRELDRRKAENPKDTSPPVLTADDKKAAADAFCSFELSLFEQFKHEKENFDKCFGAQEDAVAKVIQQKADGDTKRKTAETKLKAETDKIESDVAESDAAIAKANEKDDDGFPLLLVVIGVVLICCILGIVIAVVMMTGGKGGGGAAKGGLQNQMGYNPNQTQAFENPMYQAEGPGYGQQPGYDQYGQAAAYGQQPGYDQYGQQPGGYPPQAQQAMYDNQYGQQAGGYPPQVQQGLYDEPAAGMVEASDELYDEPEIRIPGAEVQGGSYLDVQPEDGVSSEEEETDDEDEDEDQTDDEPEAPAVDEDTYGGLGDAEPEADDGGGDDGGGDDERGASMVNETYGGLAETEGNDDEGDEGEDDDEGEEDDDEDEDETDDEEEDDDDDEEDDE